MWRQDVATTTQDGAATKDYSAKIDEYNKQVHGVEKKDYSELMNKLVAIKYGSN